MFTFQILIEICIKQDGQIKHKTWNKGMKANNGNYGDWLDVA